MWSVTALCLSISAHPNIHFFGRGGSTLEMLVRVTMMGLWDATRHLSLKGVESGNIILRKRPWIVLYVGCLRSPMYVIE